MDDDLQHGMDPWTPAGPDAGVGPALSSPNSPAAAPEPLPIPGAQLKWGAPTPPSGYGYAAYPGYPSAPTAPSGDPGHAAPPSDTPAQAGPQSSGWAPPGYPPQGGYGWPAAPSTPYGYVSVPPQRKGPSEVAIIGMVAVVLVVLIAATVGSLVLLRSSVGMGHTSLGLSQAQATSAAQPTVGNYGYEFKDALDGSIPLGWTSSPQCYFKDGAYHVNPGSQYAASVCMPPTGSSYDLDMRVTAMQVSGSPGNGYGLIFHRDSTADGYVFVVDGLGEAWFATLTAWKVTLRSDFGAVPAFKSGPGGQNILRVIVSGSNFTFYVDGTRVGQVTDTTYISGWSGLYSGGSGLDAAFTNFRLDGNS
jgi:hypothetical protein